MSLISEDNLYDSVWVRTRFVGGRGRWVYESAVENDEKKKRLVITRYKSEADASGLHWLAVMWANTIKP